MSNSIDYKRIYEFYKVTINDENSKDYIGDCPLCNEDNHFSIKRETGQFRCFKCDSQGNIFTFLTELHVVHLSRTTEDSIRSLAVQRGLRARDLTLAQFAYDPDYERWLIPFANGSKFLNNLGVIYPNSSLGYRVLKAPELPVKLYRPFDRKALKDQVWVFEGESDLIAARGALKSSGMKILPSLVSTSGANNWNEGFNKAVKGKSLTFFLNNDEAGEKAKEKLPSKISGCTYGFINWPDKYETINDVRDLWTTRKARGIKSVAEELFELEATASPSIPEKSEGNGSTLDSDYDTDFDQIEEIESYREYHKRLAKDLYLNESMKMSHDLVLAITLSIKLPHKPIYCFLVGQQSTGKSVTIESYGGISEHFDYVSKITGESIVSGYKDKEGTDFSQLPGWDGKTVFFGDLTVLLSLPEAVQEKVWGVFRETYMGVFDARFGNQKAKRYKGFKFNIVAGVTHAIYTVNTSDMGERFIKIDFTGDDFDEDAHMDAAIRTQDYWDEVAQNLKETTLGYFKYLINSIDFSTSPEISEGVLEKIKSLAKLTSRLQTKVLKDRWEGMITRPQCGSPSRFVTTLQTLAKCLMWIHQVDTVTPYIYKTLKKVAFDSSPGLGLEVVRYIHSHPGATVTSLQRELRIPKTRLRQITDDFLSLHILQYVEVNNGSGRRGRNVHKFQVTDPIKNALDGVHSSRRPSKSTKFTSKPSKRRISV